MAWHQQAQRQAHQAQIDVAEVDWLVQGLCQVDRLALRLGTVAQHPYVAARVSLAELDHRWQRRVHDRVPVQQLVGQTPWRNFMVQVSPAVLIPRPETELLIDQVLAFVAHRPDADHWRQGPWVDLGTGSGAIALGLADIFPEATIVAIDISAAALAVARANGVAHGFGDRIHYLQGSWLTPLAPWQGQLAGLVSNPPYIPSAVVPTLQPEVAHHEPQLALDGGPDGLTYLRHLVNAAPAMLQPGGIWAVEVMAGQAPVVRAMLAQTEHYCALTTAPDLAGVDRFVLAQTRPAAVNRRR